jgi:hypothetical protein
VVWGPRREQPSIHARGGKPKRQAFPPDNCSLRTSNCAAALGSGCLSDGSWADSGADAVTKKKSRQITAEAQAATLAKLRRDRELRQTGYRERALALFPHVCASCGREFAGKRLKELTVHHKDGNHQNNPNDGSNWELLCLYCHDHEHEKYQLAGQVDLEKNAGPAPAKMANPFAKLDDLLKPKPGPAPPTDSR